MPKFLTSAHKVFDVLLYNLIYNFYDLLRFRANPGYKSNSMEVH